uniref:Uncharacterized protein n=1 Tax=Physcomitrium patens TaxID=3218 RepID=A0A2K1ICP7_PHYPA|nr:hypothetical protein PHYPA_030529 [Physcomitrium patens]
MLATTTTGQALNMLVQPASTGGGRCMSSDNHCGVVTPLIIPMLDG